MIAPIAASRFSLTATRRTTAVGDRFVTVTGTGLDQPAEYLSCDESPAELRRAVAYTWLRLVAVPREPQP